MVGEDAAEETRPKRKLGKRRYEVKELYSRDSTHNRGVEGISFQVRRGEIYGIAGIGGNGQTRLSNALIGMVQPDSGTSFSMIPASDIALLPSVGQLVFGSYLQIALNTESLRIIGHMRISA
jgi:ABC-type uncharacterized transport system ATPase subunit